MGFLPQVAPQVAATGRLPDAAVFAIGAAILVVGVVVALLVGRRLGRRGLSQRLTALGTRLGVEPPEEDGNIETALAYLEATTGAASQAVAESSADAIRLRRSLDTLPHGVVISDENGHVVYRNARAGSLMAGRHGDVLAAQAVEELLEEAWHATVAERTLDLYGPPRRTLMVRAQMIDDGRRSLGVIATIEDVSERRRLEEVRRDFVANVSHELKTPMGALVLLAETLAAEPDVDVAKRLANRIHAEAFRVSRIIDDLLDLSRIEAEQAPPREPVLVDLVMAEAVERVRAMAEQRGITIELVEPAPPVALVGDRRQLVSAMHALLENAVVYSYDGGTVTVSGSVCDVEAPAMAAGTEEPARIGAGILARPADIATGRPAASTVAGGMEAPAPDSAAFSAPGAGNGNGERRRVVALRVADRGIGIPARDLERIFERFYRVDHGRGRETGGTGLGLSIVRHVANNHQGWVTVESREGEGSTFTLMLPLQAEPAS
ncbi:MAG TPA: ATP-binding protein [Acidimicrobiales bacterium]|nr:ATP-binding protein [Acidimicrobiales bacterium]